ncbi:MAG: hypothetical protein JST70_06905 [Bacteroidetes bacterium]|nr:hypothetical protein [Bacteroidota bacterium]
MPVYFLSWVSKKLWALDILLFVIFLLFACIIMYCYPVPQLTWDSFYYVKASITGDYGIRPAGYAIFLKITHLFLSDIQGVAYVQFFLHFLSLLFLLRVIKNVFNVSSVVYIVLGLLLIAEPVALYYANNILSDILFSAISTAALASLLWYLSKPSILLLALHLLLVFLAVEVRLIALFYPFFTCAVLLATWPGVRSFVSCVVIALLCGMLWQWHVSINKKQYGVAIYSAFSDWTVANNALYSLYYVDENSIKNPNIQAQHLFFRHYMDTSSFKVNEIGSPYLWDDASPLNYIRIHKTDSLHLSYNASWFYVAPEFGTYGSYIQWHFPGLYIKTFVVPNLATMQNPLYGEMADYRLTKFMDTITLNRYHLQPEQVKFRKEPYRRRINGVIAASYPVEFILFILSGVLFFVNRRKWPLTGGKLMCVLLAFPVLYYGAMLWSSSFIFRYLIPVYPIVYTVIVLNISALLNKQSATVNS